MYLFITCCNAMESSKSEHVEYESGGACGNSSTSTNIESTSKVC